MHTVRRIIGKRFLSGERLYDMFGVIQKKSTKIWPGALQDPCSSSSTYRKSTTHSSGEQHTLSGPSRHDSCCSHKAWWLINSETLLGSSAYIWLCQTDQHQHKTSRMVRSVKKPQRIRLQSLILHKGCCYITSIVHTTTGTKPSVLKHSSQRTLAYHQA